MSHNILRIFVVATILFFSAEVSFAQRPQRGGGGPPGGGGGRRPPAAEGAQGAPNVAAEPAPPTFEESVAKSTSPDLSLLTPPRSLEFTPAMNLPGTGPVVPAKVVRLAAWTLEKYDKDGDGVLSQEEWESMPGSPQAIDIDGDTKITLDEMIRHIARFGDKRTLHSPEGPRVVSTPQVNAEQIRLFRPVSIPITQKKTDSTPESREKTDQPGDVGEAMVTEGEDLVELSEDDDVTIELIFGSGTKSAERKYYRPLEDMKGVPGWFIARDKNGDGQLSLLEFAPNLSPDGLALFGRLDKNKDGFITPDELTESN